MAIDSKIRQIIAENGHIKIDEMMREVLSLHSNSYYKTLKNIGSDSDFITSPEISQLFGEIIAIWAITKWKKIGRPDEFILLELGPGTGSLIHDFLRVCNIEPDFLRTMEIYLYDINLNFISKQREKLAPLKKEIKWIDNFENLPSKPLIVIANEFFDALPIKQYIKVKKYWFEYIFITDPFTGNIQYNKMSIPEHLQIQLDMEHVNANDGAVFEESIESLAIIRELSRHVKNHGGSALIIDYGYNIKAENRKRSQYNSTLQAMKNHKYWPIIDTLGEADITAHVDFNALEKAAREQKIVKFDYCTQREFLLNYGIELRSKILQKSLSQEEHYIIDKQVERLVSPSMMGELFKVLSFTSLK